MYENLNKNSIIDVASTLINEMNLRQSSRINCL